jgi:hypothetical protein
MSNCAAYPQVSGGNPPRNLAIRIGHNSRLTLALYRRRAFRKKVRVSTVFWRAFDKAVRRKPRAVAADAGPLQIQLWEDSVPSCAGTVRESTAAGTEREESNVGAKFS